jgi:NitT/TauT family transport system substrate-binding protein
VNNVMSNWSYRSLESASPFVEARVGAWKWKAVAATAAVFAWMIFGTAPARAIERTKVTVSILGLSATMWPLLAAKDKGYLSDAGIDVDIIHTGSSARSAQQAAAGSVDIGNSSVFDAFRAIDNGANLKIVLSSQAVATHMLFASRFVKSIADLKGKRVMTGGAKDITNLWWEAAARHFGLDPRNDVDLIFSGATSARYAALIGGAVDAAVLAVPQTFDAEDKGYTNLGFVAPYLGDVPTNVWYVNGKWALSHEANIMAFVKANKHAVRFMLDPRNKDEAVAILSKATNVCDSIAARTYDLCVRAKAFVADGDISQAGLEKTRAMLDEAGDLQKPLKPISAYFDGHYIATAR